MNPQNSTSAQQTHHKHLRLIFTSSPSYWSLGCFHLASSSSSFCTWHIQKFSMSFSKCTECLNISRSAKWSSVDSGTHDTSVYRLGVGWHLGLYCRIHHEINRLGLSLKPELAGLTIYSLLIILIHVMCYKHIKCDVQTEMSLKPPRLCSFW